MLDVGDGCDAVEFWEGGRVVVEWDGRNHIDINPSVVPASDGLGGGLVVANFDERFNEQLPFDMKTMLHNVQSSGYGGMVSFLKGTESGFDPI